MLDQNYLNLFSRTEGDKITVNIRNSLYRYLLLSHGEFRRLIQLFIAFKLYANLLTFFDKFYPFVKYLPTFLTREFVLIVDTLKTIKNIEIIILEYLPTF